MGAYFVTICTRDRIPHFGEIRGGVMGLSMIGDIAHRYWQEIPDHFPHVTLDEWIVMPNHMHGIVVIGDAPPSPRRDVAMQRLYDDRANRNNPHPDPAMAAISPKPGSLSTIIRSFKSACTREIRAAHPRYAIRLAATLPRPHHPG